MSKFNNEKLKIGFIGCVKSSRMALEVLTSLDYVDVIAVITKQQSKVNSDFTDLTDICVARGIPFHYEDGKKKLDSVKFFEQFSFDVIYCFGWSYLLKDSFLKMTPLGVIGFHPAKLPQNRGRHPIIWAIALGLEETASTFFQMDEGADSGPIVSQKLIGIAIEDDSLSVYDKVLVEAKLQIIEFTYEIFINDLTLKVQDDNKANYWRKRSRKDGLIDWRMGPKPIYDLVRALAPPYPGAEFFYADKYYIVNKTELALGNYANNIEPGYILERAENSLLIKLSGKDAIWLKELEFDTAQFGEYL